MIALGTEIEDAIETRLTELFPNVKIYIDPRHEIEPPCILVQYQGAEFDPILLREDPRSQPTTPTQNVSHNAEIMLLSPRSAGRSSLDTWQEIIYDLPNYLQQESQLQQRWRWASIDRQEFDATELDTPRSIICSLIIEEIG